ncbi:MAG: ATP-dependent helicase HrpB [Gammaproteobacteria bacterium]|nr:ATP-dependent helicase HrpB [Gammaproteobacteria bacterium]
MDLPVKAVLPELYQALGRHQRAILVAPPGAGKTTQVPLYLLQQLQQQEPKSGSRILLLEPRRLAVRNTAEFLAQQIGEQVGQCIGYRMRQDSKISPQTRLEVITEGVLLRLLQDDPALENVHSIIFDEFHERSLTADLGLSLSLQSNELFRSQTPIRLLLMSATLETDKLATFLSPAPVIVSAGRQYPITYHYLAQTPQPQKRLQVWAQSVEQALADQAGSILVFLSGQGDIQRLHQQLQHLITDKLSIYPLYGRLTLQEQRQAIAPAANGHRKIVLATNIAETSLTIEGINCVLDTGLYKQAIFEAGSGLTRLHTRMISTASASQRAGRAGRLQAGHCYRLWSRHQQQALAPQNQPAIKQSDLSALVLQLLACGYAHMHELRWLDTPSAGAWQQAVNLLTELQAVQHLDHGLTLTKHGQRLSKTGLEPRLAQLLIAGIDCQQMGNTCRLISKLEHPHQSDHADLSIAVQQALTHTQQQLVQQLQANTKRLATPEPQNTPALANWLVFTIATAWPDRVAQKQQQQADSAYYKLANGRGVQLIWPAHKPAPEYLVVTNTFAGRQQKQQPTSRDQICGYVILTLEDITYALAHRLNTTAICEWNAKTDRLDLYQAQRLGALVLHQAPTISASPSAKAAAICEYLKASDLTPLNWSTQVQQWLCRLRLLYSSAPADNNPWPDLSHDWLVTNIEVWLAPYLQDISSGKQLAKVDLLSILQNQLDYALQQQMQKQAPQRLCVPSGHYHAIDYTAQPPVLAVKLQELFGMHKVPAVAYGVALQVHLLSPAGRVMQITQDLAHFWRHSYTEVKKDMQGRYPKHPWPDNPLTAVATAKTKRRS